MPNKKSAAKRMRSDAKKRLWNQSALSELHTRYRNLVEEVKSSPEKAKEQARILISKFDKAVSHGIIPHRRADRKKARIGKLLSKKS
ncbi:MAG: 30S ribosomal protein S20 [Candidatus Omnitrophica bacterium]|nr:30S ribosomal protein S20 [Candidatus Omnitrophota bacterium]